jgi:Glycosyltransferase family 87
LSLSGARTRRSASAPRSSTLLQRYPAAFLLIYLMRRRYAVVGWFTAFFAINLLVAAAVLPTAVWREWVANIASTGGYGQIPFGLFSPSSIGNQNFNGLFMRLFGEGDLARFCTTIAASVCGAMALGAIAALRRAGDETFYGFSYALISVLVFLAAPLSWFHHSVFLIPALAFAAPYVSRMRDGPGAIAAQAALLGALVACAYGWPAKDMEPLASPLLRPAPLLAPLLLFALLLALAAHANARSAKARSAADALGAAAASQISR